MWVSLFLGPRDHAPFGEESHICARPYFVQGQRDRGLVNGQGTSDKVFW